MMLKREEFAKKERFTFEDLVDLMTILRSDTGCPWDREQTHESIRTNLIEETYEAVEGIDKNDAAIMREEFGDVLLQVVFHAEIAKESGEFDMDDVITDVCKKLVERHPHIFADVKADTADKVLDNWNQIKAATKHQKTLYDKLESISKALPSLMRAKKMASKIRKDGAVYQSEDLQTLSAQLSSAETREEKEETLGRMLFALSVYSDQNDIDAEAALYNACEATLESYKE